MSASTRVDKYRFAESGIVLESEFKLVDRNGTPYAILYVRPYLFSTCSTNSRYAIPQSGSFNLGAKGTGKPFSKRIAGAPSAKPVPKDRKPDWVVSDKTTPEQAIIYRLSGDYNGLHIGE